MKKKSIIIIVFAILAVIVAVRLLGRDRTDALTVRITEAEIGDIQSWLSPMRWSSQRRKSYYGTSGLKVTKIHVEVGDTVRKGDVILR